MRKRFLLMICLMPCCLTLSFGMEEGTNAAGYKLVAFNTERLDQLLSPLNIQGKYCSGIRRNRAGTEIYIWVTYPKKGVITISGNSAPTISDDHRFRNELGEVVAWYENKRSFLPNGSSIEQRIFFFSNGSSINLSNSVASVGFAPGNDFFYISNRRMTTIHNVKEPIIPVISLGTNFWATRLFVSNSMIDVAGFSHRSATAKSRKSKTEWKLLRFRRRANGLPLKMEEVVTEGPIIEMNPAGTVLLYQTPSDFFPKWVIINLNSKKTKNIGPVKGEALFLQPDFAKRFGEKAIINF